MVAVAEHAPPTPRRAIDGAGEADLEPTGSGDERGAMRCLDDEVDVVVLYREGRHTKPLALGEGERGVDSGEEVEATERWEAGGHTQRQVQRV